MNFLGKKLSLNGKHQLQQDNYIKIAYFDVISINDYLKVKFGGDRAHEITDSGKTATSIGGDSELSGQAGGKTKATGGLLIGSGLKARVQRDSSRHKNTQVKNTSLTDYLNLYHEDNDIVAFKGYTLTPYSQSITHLKMLAPYVSIIDGKIPVDGASDIYLDLKSFDTSLNNARGYFEMIANKSGGQEIVLRFNGEAFHNNYSLYDITKMDLVFHALKVGTSKVVGLSLVDEINKITQGDKKPPIPSDGFTREERHGDMKNQEPKDLDIYDVVFAGVVGER